MKNPLMLAMLPVAVGASATCLTDPPEIGDIGPDSALVCRALERQFPGAALAVEGRSIHSATEVWVTASVDSRPVRLHYSLAGFSWTLDNAGQRVGMH